MHLIKACFEWKNVVFRYGLNRSSKTDAQSTDLMQKMAAIDFYYAQ